MLYEGYLTSAGGGPAADGSYTVTFSLYDGEKAATAFWQEANVKISVSGGVFSYALGATKPVSIGQLQSVKSLWIGVKIGAESELPRSMVHSVPFAHVAQAANGLLCTGCVSVKSIKFDDNIDLGGNSIKAKGITAVTITASTVQAQQFIGDGSKLTGITIPTGTCKAGELVNGIKADGSLSCASAAASLPKDGLDEVSNGVLKNQFVESFSMPATDKDKGIPDNTGVDLVSSINVPGLGTTEQFFRIAVDLQNSDLSTVSVTLLPPNDKKVGITLCDPCGNKNAKTLKTSYPDKSKVKTGDLSKWIGKDPKGIWNLKVKDVAFCLPQLDAVNCDVKNSRDGKLNSWSLSTQVLSNQKVQVTGDLVVTGKVLTENKEIKLGAVSDVCDASRAGVVRFKNGAFEGCNGKSWAGLGFQGFTYRWNRWTDYLRGGSSNWAMDNNSSLFGGVNPSNWSSNSTASSMSSTTELLRTLFVRNGPPLGNLQNAMVFADSRRQYNDSNVSRHVAVLFRVKNTSDKDITWPVYWYHTSYGGWSERSSIAVNGQNTYNSGSSNYYANHKSNHNLTIPKNRTSTVIFVVSAAPFDTSSYYGGNRPTQLGFYNNCLKLPTGLEFVDDLDTKPNGWDK